MSAAVVDRHEVVNFGCRLNIAEGEAIRSAISAAGATDTIVFNSCAVTDEAVRQARQAVRRALRERPGAEVVVTGCAAELEAERFAEIGARVVRNDAKGLAESYLPNSPPFPREGGGPSSAIASANEGRRQDESVGDGPLPSQGRSLPYAPALSGADQARAFLGVQTGCSHSCTFCATVMARGTARSATVDAVLDSARTALDRGQREIILTGVDLASYGDDSGTTLAALVEALLTLPIERLRLSSLDPDRSVRVRLAGEKAWITVKGRTHGISRAEFDAGHAARPDRAERGPGPERARSGPRGGPRHAMRGPEGRERGPVVISEVAAKLGEQFDKMDADRNGVVTADERRADMTAHRAERRAERGGERQQRRAVRPAQQPASPAPASE